MSKNIPKSEDLEKNDQIFKKYQTIGMMTLLDLLYFQGELEKSISEYYSDLALSVDENRYLLTKDGDGKPQSYITWIATSNPSSNIQITRQAAPFGDHFAQLSSLQRRFPELKNVDSLHFRSGRKVQSAW